MTDMQHKDKSSPEDRAARRYTVWMILWVLIAWAILTSIFAFTYGEEQVLPMDPAQRVELHLSTVAQ